MKWKELVSLESSKAKALGVQYTPKEIAQQPRVWEKTAAAVSKIMDQIASFVKPRYEQKSGGCSVPLILAGAGTSEFVGRCLEPVLTGAGFTAAARPTTDIVVYPELYLPDGEFMLVSFARSGNSPESIAAVNLLDELRPRARHLIITCNPSGQLAHYAQHSGDRCLVIQLPEETNDQGLAMTSSFSSMFIAGQALVHLGSPETYTARVAAQAQAAQRFMDQYADSILELADQDFDRIVFVGSGPMYGLALESHLKVQELTAGRVVGKAESILGLRHGPMAVINQNTMVVFLLSQDPYVQQYERDLMQQIAAKNVAGYTVALTGHQSPELTEYVDIVLEIDQGGSMTLADTETVPVYVLFSQILALAKSVHLGLTPDTPGQGVIHRVVQGVTTYPYQVQKQQNDTIRDLVIRPVRPDDAPDINDIRRQRSVVEFTLSLPSERISKNEKYIENLGPDDHVMVAEINGKVVAIAGLHVRRGKDRHVGHLGICVHETYQGQGIGRKLMETLLDLADNYLGLVRTELEVLDGNVRAQRLYESLGFEVEGRRRCAVYRRGQYVDAVLMSRLVLPQDRR